MSGVEQIQAAEEAVAGVQDALSMVQSGLHTAEEIALATEQTTARAKHLLKVTFVLIGISIVLIALSRRRRRRGRSRSLGRSRSPGDSEQAPNGVEDVADDDV